MGDVNLDEIAEQELLNEAKRGAARASLYGALGWQKCPLNPTNKVFLQNILLSTLSSKHQRDTNSKDQEDNSKRKLSNDDLRVHDLKRHSTGTKKSVKYERNTLVTLSSIGTSNTSDSRNNKPRNFSWEKRSRCSKLINNEGDVPPSGKRRIYQNVSKAVTSKSQKDDKNLTQ